MVLASAEASYVSGAVLPAAGWKPILKARREGYSVVPLCRLRTIADSTSSPRRQNACTRRRSEFTHHENTVPTAVCRSTAATGSKFRTIASAPPKGGAFVLRRPTVRVGDPRFELRRSRPAAKNLPSLNLCKRRVRKALLASPPVQEYRWNLGMNMEHRCGYRRQASAAIVIRTPDGLAASGRLRDISASGALIVSHLPAPLHGQVLVQLTAGPRKNHRSAVVIRGQVVRHMPGGFAIEWADFSPPAVRALLRQIAAEESAAPRATTSAG